MITFDISAPIYIIEFLGNQGSICSHHSKTNVLGLPFPAKYYLTAALSFSGAEKAIF